MRELSGTEKWSHFKQYLEAKEQDILRELRERALTASDDLAIRLLPQLALVAQLRSKAEQLDNPTQMDPSFAPPND